MQETNPTSLPKRGSAEPSPPASPKPLPYRWGYFQGALLIPFSLLAILASIGDLRKLHWEPWPLSVIWLLIGLVGVPLGVGLLEKKRYGYILVHVILGLSVLLVAVKLPVAMTHFSDSGANGSGISEAEFLVVWLLCTAYYRKRQAQFR